MTENPSSTARTVFIVSDGTGLTAEAHARSVLTQFDMEFQQVRLPFVDTPEKIQEVIKKIEENYQETGERPIVFSTFVKPELLSILQQTDACHIDLIQHVIAKLTPVLGAESKQQIGLSHQNAESDEYEDRMEAIHFTIAHDDGQSHANLEAADLILLGVSRSGKTPTSLYLAIHYGLKVANYPLIPEDFERGRLPNILQPYHKKLFGLSIDAERLSQIRNARRPNSKYASIENCRYEVRQAETIMERERILWLPSTNKSIEEISSTIVHQLESVKPRN